VKESIEELISMIDNFFNYKKEPTKVKLISVVKSPYIERKITYTYKNMETGQVKSSRHDFMDNDGNFDWDSFYYYHGANGFSDYE